MREGQTDTCTEVESNLHLSPVTWLHCLALKWQDTPTGKLLMSTVTSSVDSGWLYCYESSHNSAPCPINTTRK